MAKNSDDTESTFNSEDDTDYENENEDFDIQSATSSYQLRSFYDQYLKTNKINLCPDYQRDFTWNIEKQNLFIDSIIRGYIIPNIIMRKIGSKYECVDGQHRLKVIKHYIESTKILDVNIRWEKKEENTIKRYLYEENELSKLIRMQNKGYLSKHHKDRFDSYQLNVTIINSKIDESQMCQIFTRLQNGERITNIDKFKNSCQHPLIKYIKDNNLFSYKTYSENPWNILFDKYLSSSKCITKTTSKRHLILAIVRFGLIKQNKSLNCGSYLDLNIEKYLEANSPIVNITIDIKDIFDDLIKFLEDIVDLNVKLCKYLLFIFMHLYLNNKNLYKKMKEKINDIADTDYNKYETYEYDNLHKKLIVPDHQKLENILDKITEEYFNDEQELLDEKIPKKLPKTIRAMVWDEYIGEEKGTGKCYVCKIKINSKHYECGHIIARANGGNDAIENLRPVCSLCNKSIGTINMDDFKRKYIKTTNNSSNEESQEYYEKPIKQIIVKKNLMKNQ